MWLPKLLRELSSGPRGSCNDVTGEISHQHTGVGKGKKKKTFLKLCIIIFPGMFCARISLPQPPAVFLSSRPPFYLCFLSPRFPYLNEFFRGCPLEKYFSNELLRFRVKNFNSFPFFFLLSFLRSIKICATAFGSLIARWVVMKKKI